MSDRAAQNLRNAGLWWVPRLHHLYKDLVALIYYVILYKHPGGNFQALCAKYREEEGALSE